MKRKQAGRGLFYTRDSGGKHETTPGEYVGWGLAQATKLGLAFGGTPDQIAKMIRENEFKTGDIFLDYGVSGNLLSRPGLNALLAEVASDHSVTHVMIPRRDRLARPQDAVDGLKLENLILRQGVSLVFMDGIVAAPARGERMNIAYSILATVEYEAAGRQRRELAEKMIHAQLSLARDGYSTGGRPPFGFRRWLVDESGKRDRQLEDGERVRKARHHVVWLPGPDDEIELIRRILEMLKTMPATQVAISLTREGIPSPDAGRKRRDNGIEHMVSGIWHQTSVVNIARNPLLRALTRYGLRSMGDQLRFSPNGPREVVDSDFRSDEKPKVIRNTEADRITAPAHFEPLVEKDDHDALIQDLDRRAGIQRGKPRSRNPDENPLGGRVFDMACSWLMYRAPYQGSFRYVCGEYMQSHGAKCSHNHVPGPLATEFALSVIRQKLLSPSLLPMLKKRLEELAGSSTASDDNRRNLERKEALLVQAEAELKKVARNMALVEKPSQLTAMQSVFDELEGKKIDLQNEISLIKSRIIAKPTCSEIESALKLAEDLTALVRKASSMKDAGEAIRAANLKLFLRFEAVQHGKRTLNKLVGGTVTVGDAVAPIAAYSGRTDRVSMNVTVPASLTEAGTVETTCRIRTGEEDDSSGNVNRDDCPLFEPLIASYTDAVLSPSADLVVAAKVLQRSA